MNALQINRNSFARLCGLGVGKEQPADGGSRSALKQSLLKVLGDSGPDGIRLAKSLLQGGGGQGIDAEIATAAALVLRSLK